MSFQTQLSICFSNNRMWENGMSLKIRYLLEHLGISKTYLAVNKPEDVEELCKEFPDKECCTDKPMVHEI